jgi:hypothetical protein
MTASVVLPETAVLPEVGATINEFGTSIYITSVDKETRTVEFIVRKDVDKQEIMDSFKESVKHALVESAKVLFLWDKAGSFSSFIPWDDMSEDIKKPYLVLARKVLDIFYENDMVVIDPSELLSEKY